MIRQSEHLIAYLDVRDVESPSHLQNRSSFPPTVPETTFALLYSVGHSGFFYSLTNICIKLQVSLDTGNL